MKNLTKKQKGILFIILAALCENTNPSNKELLASLFAP